MQPTAACQVAVERRRAPILDREFDVWHSYARRQLARGRSGLCIRIIDDIEAGKFANKEFSGAPVHRETLEQSQVVWLAEVAEGKVGRKEFSARIKWRFTPESDGVHRFGLHCADYAQLFVDGEMVADARTNWTRGRTFFELGCDEVVGEKTLEAGRNMGSAFRPAAKGFRLLQCRGRMLARGGGAFRNLHRTVRR